MILWLFNGDSGSVMILMQGYMGNVLHTGDFRYTPLMLEDSPTLFPGFLKNNDNWKCSIHIDELILDNTYCDPVFQFPTRVISSYIWRRAYFITCKERSF